MSEKVKKLIVLIILVVCAFGSCSGQMWGEIVYDDNEAPETTQTSELEPVEEVEAVTKIYYTVGRTLPVPIVQPFSCNFQGVWYRESEEFRMGSNNCSICVCIDTDVKCNDDGCFKEIPEVVEAQKENLIPKEKLKLPEINTTVASLIPENHPETHESEDKFLTYDYATYADYDDNGTIIYVEVPKQFTCIYEGESFREDEEFKSGPDGCLHCVCQNNEVNCKNVNCPYPVAAVALESKSKKEQKVVKNEELNFYIQEVENKLGNFGRVEKFEDSLNDMDSCEY